MITDQQGQDRGKWSTGGMCAVRCPELGRLPCEVASDVGSINIAMISSEWWATCRSHHTHTNTHAHHFSHGLTQILCVCVCEHQRHCDRDKQGGCNCFIRSCWATTKLCVAIADCCFKCVQVCLVTVFFHNRSACAAWRVQRQAGSLRFTHTQTHTAETCRQ